jgi:tungstate transport system ATP-binding protein
MSPHVVIEGLEHPVGSVTLRADRLALEAGRLYVLHGPNGAGKSTLLRIMAGLIVPARGRVARNGAPVTLVHQQPYLFRGSLRRNVSFGLHARRIPPGERARLVDNALRSVGLELLAERSARTLSGGEQQRAALARALVLRPRVLLLDEPTANLDVEGQKVLRSLLDQFRSEGDPVIVWATPVLPADGLADRLLRISAGAVEVT